MSNDLENSELAGKVCDWIMDKNPTDFEIVQ